MYRRRRPGREIAFSFDSFLDVVANVVGVIIRLILVVWVGARSYHAVVDKPRPEPSSEKTAIVTAPQRELPPCRDPLEDELTKHRAELEKQQQRLLDQLRQYQYLEGVSNQTTQQLASLAAAQQAANQERNKVQRQAAEQAGTAQGAQLSLADLQKRTKAVADELRELEKLPPLTRTLKYHTPVSRPVQTEELQFECKAGRVSFIDIQGFMIELRRGIDDKVKQLRTQWQVEGTVGPVGAFRLRYVLEREKTAFSGSSPEAEGSYRYGLAGWVIEPIIEVRGDAADVALAANSEFRRITEALDPDQTVVTLWVYPDSFGLYRQLRDWLHERNIEVAGRPLPMGAPIATSRHGTASRGQ